MSKRAHTKAVTATYPTYAELCGNCDHNQASHLGVEGASLTGRFVKCRETGCGCDRWVATWK